MSERRNAILYVRISSDRDGDELGVTRQREDGLAMAQRRGWHVVRVIPDNDMSAKGHRVRPGFEEALGLIADGTADAVISWDMTRFLRSARDRLRMLELGKERGTILAFVRGSEIDLGTPAGRLTADILGSVALHEIEQKSDRQRRATIQAAEQGRRIGGRRPFGYEPDGVTIRETEAAAYRAACSAVLAGVSLRAVAAELNGAGLLTPQATKTGEPSRWTGQTVRNMILNPRYAGLRSHVTAELRAKLHPVQARLAGIVGPAAWEALVPEETWRAVVALLSEPSRNNGGGGVAARALLTGEALCGVCQVTVHGGRQPQGHRTYRCRAGAGHVVRMAEPVDDYVAALVIERLSRPDALALLTAEDGPDGGPSPVELAEQASALRARLDSLAADFAEGDLTPSQLRTATARIRERLAETERQQAEAGRVNVLGPMVQAEDAAAVWAELDNDRRRAIVGALMSITLLPPGRGTRTFRPETVEITWRVAA